MNPQGADLLSQLRDIHAAPAVPWWPPAPGWWALALLAGIGLFFIVRRARRHLQRQLRRRRLQRCVDRLEKTVDPVDEPQEFLSSLNRIFKIVAMDAFPGARCAQLRGAEWSGFLKERVGAGPDTGPLDALADGPYRPSPQFDHEALTSLARRWIRQYG